MPVWSMRQKLRLQKRFCFVIYVFRALENKLLRWTVKRLTFFEIGFILFFKNFSFIF